MFTKEQRIKFKAYMKLNKIVIKDIAKELHISNNIICDLTTLKKDVNSPVYEKILTDWYKEKTGNVL